MTATVEGVLGDIPRSDAASKARGTERYAIDHQPEGCLRAGAFRPGAVHGRVLRVHAEAALAVPGVVKVLTAADVPGTNRQGIVHKDQPVLCGDRVLHAGDPVALVLAETPEALRAGLAALRADIEPLPAVVDPVAALRRGAPILHPDHKGGNLLLRAVIEKGEARARSRTAPVVVRGKFSLGSQEHAFLEPQCGTARRLDDGSLDMTVSTQAPFRDRFEIAHALGLSPMAIRVRAPHLGGGFGGKDGSTVQCLLALAALHADGRPVGMVWEREESVLAGYKRHPVTLDYTLGAEEDGTLVALVCRAVFDTGAYAHLGVEVMELGLEHAAGPYRVPNTWIEGRCVYTNNPIAGAFRGFGVAQVSLGFEGMMEALADRLGMDPAELRRKNLLRRGDVNGAGVTLTTSTRIDDCLRVAAEHPMWTTREEWRKAAPPLIRRGVGLAAVFNAMGYGRGLPDMAVAKVELTETGEFLVYNAVPDMGQGNSSTFGALAARALNQAQESVRVIAPDTELCHPSGSSSAGRTTHSFAGALSRALVSMRTKLLSRACQALFIDDPTRPELVPGAVRDPVTGRVVPLKFLARFLSRDDRVIVAEYVMPVAANPPATGKAFAIGFPHLIFTHAVHIVRLEIDELTGRVRPLDYLAVTDGGRVFHRQGFDQQAQGGVAQGLGYALFEDLAIKEGRIRARDFSTYLIPTATDLPEITSLAVDPDMNEDATEIKGVGEVGMNGPAPAVAAALFHALGTPLRDAPFTPERVLAALRKGKRRRR